MQRRVNDLQVTRPSSDLFQVFLQKRLVDLFTAKDDLLLRKRICEYHVFDLVNFFHFRDTVAIVGRYQLPTSRPIHLYGIIAGRVMAGGHHNAAVTIFVANEK